MAPHATQFVIFQLHNANGDGWRWRALRAGRVLARSGEVYSRLNDARRAMNGFLGGIGAGTVQFVVIAAGKEVEPMAKGKGGMKGGKKKGGGKGC